MDVLKFPGDPASSPAGLILAIDTAGEEGSLALGRLSGRGRVALEILARTVLGADDEHASLIVPRVHDLMTNIGSDAGELSGVVLGSGPGSFTGVRVGAATAKGLVWALGLPLWAFSSLLGAAADVSEEPARPRLVLFDARGDRVYAAAYRITPDSVDTLLTPRATTVGEVLDDHIPPGALLMGDGAERHRALLEGAGHRVLPYPAGRPSAEGLLRLFTLTPDPVPVFPVGRWEPEYLRESGAERMWKTKRDWKGS